MKYQRQHDLLDPDVPSPEMGLGAEADVGPDIGDDAYVIGENGNTVRTVDLRPSKRARRGLEHWAKPAAFGLAAVFVVMTEWNLSRLLEGPPPPPKPTDFQTKQALYLGVMKIDAYRRVNGVTPDSLAAVGLPAEGAYAYQRVSPARYILSFQGNGPKTEYDSSVSKEQFFGSPRDMLTIGGSR